LIAGALALAGLTGLRVDAASSAGSAVGLVRRQVDAFGAAGVEVAGALAAAAEALALDRANVATLATVVAVGSGVHAAATAQRKRLGTALGLGATRPEIADEPDLAGAVAAAAVIGVGRDGGADLSARHRLVQALLAEQGDARERRRVGVSRAAGAQRCEEEQEQRQQVAGEPPSPAEVMGPSRHR
jgi:hypothetical protein